MPPAARPSRVTIAVLGDSLADGLWGSFFRAFAECGTVEVVRATTVSDGLAKSGAEDWLARLGAAAPDLVVVQMGANDITNIRDGTSRAVFGTPEWEATYGARAAALAAGLAATGAGGDLARSADRRPGPLRGQLPRDHRDAGRRGRGGGRAPSSTPTSRPPSASASSSCRPRLEGRLTRQIRVTDQVHFTEAGYDMVAGLLAADVARIFRKAGTAPPSTPCRCNEAGALLCISPPWRSPPAPPKAAAPRRRTSAPC